jgi:hypothetical protein
MVVVNSGAGCGTRAPSQSSEWMDVSADVREDDDHDIMLNFNRPIERVHADPQVDADRGRVTLKMGPIVYCAEALDNGGSARNLLLPPKSKIEEKQRADLLGGVTVLEAEGLAVVGRRDGEFATEPRKITLMPYFAWANRTPGEMAVWLPETPELARIPGETGVRQNGARVTASHCWHTDKLEALNDGVLPKSSNDESIARQTFWDHRGTREWLQYDFDAPKTLDRSRVYWFDDTGKGSCRSPKSWRLLYRDGEQWKPVVLANSTSYGIARDAWQAVEFEPVTTGALRMEVELQPNFSAGVLEWTVEEARK